MKFTVNRESFSEAFSQAAAVAPSRHNIGVLSNALICVGPDRSYVEATDSEMAIRVDFHPTAIESEGLSLVPAASFGAMIRECSEELIQIYLGKNNQLTIAGQNFKHQLRTVDAAEFPRVEPKDESFAVSFDIPAVALSGAIKATVFCSDEETRYAYQCVNLDCDEKTVSFVATNGSRLGVAELNIAAGATMNALIPSKAAKAIARSIGGSGDVRVSISSNWIRVQSADVLVLSRLSEGRFPRWRDCFPAKRDRTSIVLPASVLASAVRQASVSCRDDQTTAAVNLSLADGSLEVKAASADSDSDIRIPVSSNGDKFKVSLNWRYLLSSLGGFDPQDSIELNVGDSSQSVVLQHGDLRYIVMPLSTDR